MRTKLAEGESVVRISRKHWLYTGIPLLFFVVFLVFYIYACSAPQLKQLTGVLWVFPVGALLLFVYRYFDRKYNIWIVTDRRVIDEWGIIAHNAKETPIDRIQNITYMQSVLGRIFGFGDVRIQTAAISGVTIYSFVEKPKLLVDSIVECQNAFKVKQVEEQVTKMAAAIAKSTGEGTSEQTVN